MLDSISSRLLAAAALLGGAGALALTLSAPASGRVRPMRILVRVNQVGYPETGAKQIVVLASRALGGVSVELRNTAGGAAAHLRLGRRAARWSDRFPAAYPVALPAAIAPGTYRVQVASGRSVARSAPFRIAAPLGLYATAIDNGVRFLRAQRDGPDVDPSVMNRQPSHLLDEHATVYAAPRYRGLTLASKLRALGGPVDVSGGWFDAGDYLKFFETASFTETMLLVSLRDHPAAFPDRAAALAEARFGADWLLKMWSPGSGTLLYQVGIGDGNDTSVLGAHDAPWRLPQAEDHLRVKPGSPEYFVAHRPVLRTSARSGVSPNLAGRGAAAFALCAQVFATSDPPFAQRCLDAAETLYAAARTSHVGRLTTADPYAYYPELEWRDDMELGGIEIARALAAPGRPPSAAELSYLHRGSLWADAYMSSPLDGTDTLNLYDVGALAHAELAPMINPQTETTIEVSRGEMVHDLGDQLRAAQRFARRDPFGYGAGYGDADVVQHALGLALEARYYDAMAGSSRYAAFAARQLDLVLGANAWGVSFIVGDGSRTPSCLHDEIANLAGSLTGGAPQLLGAAVPGPVPASSLRGLQGPDGYRRCPRGRSNPYAAFAGHGAVFADNAIDSPTVEPSDDIDALAVAAFAQASAG